MDCISYSKIFCDLPSGTSIEQPVWIINQLGGTSNSFGKMSFKECDFGTFQDDLSCQPCPPGFYSNNLNSRICISCQSGHFTPDFSSTVCGPCGPNSSPNSDKSNCICDKG